MKKNNYNLKLASKHIAGREMHNRETREKKLLPYNLRLHLPNTAVNCMKGFGLVAVQDNVHFTI